MADTQEEIVIIEETDASGEKKPSTEPVSAHPSDADSKKRRLLLIGGGALLVLSLAGGGTIFYLRSHEHAPLPSPVPVSEARVPEVPKPPIDHSELEKMIEKANTLYASGKMDEALDLYNKIAVYSEAISHYNLGVIQLREGEYKEALENFKRSIDDNENRCVSAINAAVCALYLKREKEFNQYIDLASAYLPQESNSPLFSYYYSLIQYYKGHYLEALSALKHPTTSEYQLVQNNLRAKISASLGSYNDAIETLHNPLQEKDSFSLGLMYANLGDIDSARRYLSNAIGHNPSPIEENLALALVDIKAGAHADAAGLIKTTTEKFPDRVYAPYPIRVFLKPVLFNPDDVQDYYRSQKGPSLPNAYQTVFYFAPYKIFNAKQVISYIRKGTANIYIDDVEGAKAYLSESAQLSQTDQGIAKAIQKALNFRLREANAQLVNLLDKTPRHSILHYDVALTYAQMGNFDKAYEHFVRSYHLDAHNYLSGIFALMSATLSGQTNPKLASILQESLSKEPDTEEFVLYRALMEIAKNNFPGSGSWLDTKYADRPLYLAMKVLIGSKIEEKDAARKASEKLVYLQPNDLLPHLMYIDTHYRDQKPKEFARSAINYLKERRFSYDDLYFGPQITREKSVLMSVMTGQLTPMIERLKAKLQTTPENIVDITEALAEAHFYNRQFEDAYALYNQLVDTLNIKDERTLFLGACASIGAGHYQNAIALLELSKLKNPAYLETRYALSLLYLQTQNNQGAIIHLTRMGNNGFVSRYFDFAIDTDKLADDPAKFHPL